MNFISPKTERKFAERQTDRETNITYRKENATCTCKDF